MINKEHGSMEKEKKRKKRKANITVIHSQT
jgi:hypothetical protein